MLRTVFLLIALGLGAVAVGCGSDSCEEAADILKKCNSGGSGDEGGGSGDAECSGDTEKLAECIIKNKSSCERIESQCLSGGFGDGSGTGDPGDEYEF